MLVKVRDGQGKGVMGDTVQAELVHPSALNCVTGGYLLAHKLYVDCHYLASFAFVQETNQAKSCSPLGLGREPGCMFVQGSKEEYGGPSLSSAGYVH